MNKIEFNLEPVDNETLKIGNTKIEIRPFITVSEIVQLIGAYTDTYFSPVSNMGKDIPYDLVGAEYSLALEIIDAFTNIQIQDADGILVTGIQDLISRGVYAKITEKIMNYDEFRHLLDRVVSDIKEDMALKQSVGNIIDNLSNKLVDVFDKITNTDVSPESLEALKSTAKEVLEGMEKSPISNVFKEASVPVVAKKSKKKKIE